jgi:benzylsuccinate CoA-transferase BbsE subunit
MTTDQQPFSGVRILDLTYQYGRYATRLFADLGAEVIRVEPTDGLSDRKECGDSGNDFSSGFVFLNTSKKSVTVDFDSPAGKQTFDRLLGGAQMVFLERGGPLFDKIADLRVANPAVVITAISPFGLTGSLADAPASDLTLQSSGGIAWMSGRIEDAPLSLPFDQASMVGSIYAATASAIALVDVEENGIGHIIDVSIQECIAHSLQNAVQVWDLEQRVSIRGGEGTRDATENIFPCKDGLIFLASPPSVAQSWKSLVAWMNEVGHPSGKTLSEERWSNREWRLTQEAREAFHKAFTAFTMERSKDELVREAVSRRIVLAPLTRVSEVFDDPQLAHRSYFTEQVAGQRSVPFPGAPYRLSRPVWKISPPPKLGEHNTT